MSEARNLRWLWRSVDDSLRPHRNIGVASLSKEKEREILLALSQLFRKVQLMKTELNSVSEDGSETRMDCESEIKAYPEELHCLSKITLDLVCLMMIESQFIQHLAGNVLVAVSEFVAENGKNWKAFMWFLCVSVDSAIISSSGNDEEEDSDQTVSSFVSALRDHLKIAAWSVASGMIRVFRCILKNLVSDHDDDWLVSAYFDSVYSCLSNVPWDSFDELFGARKESSSERFTFMGNVIQLLCSFADHNDAVEGFSFVIALIPKMLIWCPREQEGSQYFRYKILVLMIRISFRCSLDCSVIVLWLQLLGDHFGELLRRPITSLKSIKNDSLEGSPFLANLHNNEEVNGLSSLHVQRRAIFLFLRCCLGLVIPKIGMPLKCACVKSECCGRKRCLMELKKWIQWQLSTDFLVDSKNYLPKCVNFSLAFLRLYIHEDDLLFKMLLQLLCLPYPINEEFKKDDVLFHVSYLFNHVHLFHLFLSELHYDHQVLLDYLISKDTGTSCAEYLLRSLRAVCDSWRLFLEFSVDGKRTNKSSLEKRKHISLEGDKALTEQSRPLGKKAYREAKDCLLSLLASVESLDQKKLFPYNPKVLLKRLRAFQELC